MNLANKLTLLRVIMVPFFLVFISVDSIPYGKELALAVFVLASLTDKLDGHIARSRNMITDFGKFMDPLADKLLVSAALIALVELAVIPSWIAFIILAREFAVSGLRILAASGGKVIAASWWGKIKTVIQMVAVIVALFNLIANNQFLGSLTDILMYIAVIITIISGYDYFAKNTNVINMDK